MEDCLAAMASGSQSATQLRRRTSISLLSNDQVRSSVVRELLNTERDFVKILRDLTEGYIAECRRRSDMFTQQQIDTIFGNIENLLAFQTDFLDDLEARVDRDAPHRSCIGEIFLRHVSRFIITKHKIFNFRKSSKLPKILSELNLNRFIFFREPVSVFTPNTATVTKWQRPPFKNYTNETVTVISSKLAE